MSAVISKNVVEEGDRLLPAYVNHRNGFGMNRNLKIRIADSSGSMQDWKKDNSQEVLTQIGEIAIGKWT